ncbi:MAG TPA: hypothetical protein VFX98_14655 [Longimicrobiaceae bacterium]|nr:hypothetical protein [Longimicrobiaceae bacterium]
MRGMNRVRLLLGALLLLAAAAPGAAAAQETPEAVARRYFESMRAANWTANVALMHPEALASFKQIFVQLGTGIGPEAVQELFGTDPAGLERMSGEQVYTTFMQKVMGQFGGLGEMMAGMEAEVVGHVPEGAEQAHVVYRMTMEMAGMSMNQMQVISLKRDGGTWKVLLTGDMANLGAMFRAEAPEP